MPPTAQHILIVFHDFSFGGTEVMALRLAAEWVRHGRRVTLLCGTLDGPLWSSVPAGVHVEWLQPEIGRSPLSRLRLRRALPKAIARLRPDILFLPGNFHLILAGAARGLAQRPKVVAKISNPLTPAHAAPLRWLERRAYRWAARDADWLVAMSSGLATDARQLVGTDKASVIHDPNIIGPFVPPLSAAIKARGPLHMAAAGRLVPQKDFGMAIRVTAALARTRDVRLTILGEGPERGALTRLARQLGVADRVDMPGHVEAIGPLIEPMDLLLVTSRYEGGPAVAVEALERGVPVVATDCSHFLHDVVANVDCGAIIATRDPALFASRLVEWADRPDRAPVAPRAVTAPFEAAHSAQRYLQLFDRLAAPALPASAAPASSLTPHPAH